MTVLLIIPSFLETLFTIVGLLALLGLLGLLYYLFLRPVLRARSEIDSPPPEEGYQFEIILDQVRTRTVSLGQLDSDIKTRLQGIKEDHLVLRFEKERDTEDYAITLSPGGACFWRPPHAKKTELLKSTETFDSRELIGHPVPLRIAASVKDNRALQYVEFELSTSFFINRFGEEKMRFMLTLSKLYPNVDVRSRGKKGIYMFGRLQVDAEHDQEGEEDGDS